MKEELSKTEIRDLEKYGYKIVEKDPSNLLIRCIIVICHGIKELHDSGYPFIKIFGVIDNNELVSLGWHDHYVSSVSTNTDSLGKNIFRIMPWDRKIKWKVCDDFTSYSTFQIGNLIPRENVNKEFIILQ